jgi:hypothetical protein
VKTLLEGITHQLSSYPRLPHQNFLDFSKSLENSGKKIQITENTRSIANTVLIFRICGIKVSKIQVEREGGVGAWWVMPSIRMPFFCSGNQGSQWNRL